MIGSALAKMGTGIDSLRYKDTLRGSSSTANALFPLRRSSYAGCEPNQTLWLLPRGLSLKVNS
jgi:hypothetical protein